MNCRLGNFFILLVFLLLFSFAAGCTSVRTSDTHNTTVAVQSYNSWVSNQKTFDKEVQDSVALIGDHVKTYNTEIAKDQPDHSLLSENLAQDRQQLDQWGANLDNLNTATDGFSQSTVKIQYDNATVVRTKETLGLMTQYMKIYAVDEGNARQHLIEYVNNAEAYIKPDDMDYWNDNYRQNAMQAMDQASASLAEGDTVLGNLTTEAQQLEKIQ